MVNRYGSMSETEYDLMDRTIDQIKAKFGYVNFLEIGVCDGGTVRGVYKRCEEIECLVKATGVDCLEHYKPDLPNYTFYCGDSLDMWREIKIRSDGDVHFNLLLIDGCHCVNHSMCDFLNYSPFIVGGGYCLFHDTAVPKDQYEQMAFPQDHSLAGKDPSKLGVREGLQKLGLLQGFRTDWQLIEEIPNDSGVMGMIAFQKVL